MRVVRVVAKWWLWVFIVGLVLAFVFGALFALTTVVISTWKRAGLAYSIILAVLVTYLAHLVAGPESPFTMPEVPEAQAPGTEEQQR